MKHWWSENARFIDPLGIHHWIYIAIVGALLVLLLTNKTHVKNHRKKLAFLLLIISIAQQLLLYSWYVLEMGFDVSESLPFHISRVTTILGIIYLITKNARMMDVIFFFGLFAYASFLYPQRVYEVQHVIGISFLVNHAITVLLPYFAYIAYDWRPPLNAIIRAYIAFLGYFLFVNILNPLVDGNYFYLKYRPFLHEWPDYIYLPGTLLVTFIGLLIGHVIIQTIMKRTKEKNHSHQLSNSS